MSILKEVAALGKWLSKFEGNPETRKRRTAIGAIGQGKKELARAINLQEKAVKRELLFSYPVSETLGIGDFDPIDIRWINGKPVLQPGWWRAMPQHPQRAEPEKEKK